MLLRRTNWKINILELKHRLLYYLLSFTTIFIICFEYRVELFFFLSESFLTAKKYFIYTGLLDPIFIYLKLALLFASIYCLPLLLYLLLFFLVKGFQTIYLKLYCLFLFSLFLTNIFFYNLFSKFIIPYIFDFLLSYERLEKSNVVFGLRLEATISQYYVFIFNFIIFYGILLLAPSILYLLFLSKVYTYSPKNFTRKYLYIFLGLSFLLLAPPDFSVQIIIFPFFLFLTEFYFYLVIYFFNLYKTISRF